MHILISAYACKPDSGSEAGNGWGWATHLARRGLRTHVLTLATNQPAIEAELAQTPIPNLSFSFFAPKSTRLKEGHGDHYLAWQLRAVHIARDLHAADPFDLVHHVTYGSIQVPSFLWRLGLPVVFGPVGGGQIAPPAMRSYFGASARSELLRTVFTHLLSLSPLHRYLLSRMAIVLTTNTETQRLAAQLGRPDAILCLDPGLPDSFFAPAPRTVTPHTGPLRLLWTGRVLPRKALPLTLDALARVQAPVTLTILGDSYSPNEVRDLIAARSLENKVIWRGVVPWHEVRQAYQDHDAFLFTSLRDSCAAQLLEAMALGLPVITLDLHGAHTMVPDEAGIKVPVSTPSQTVEDLVAAIECFAAATPAERSAMSSAGWSAARTLAWPGRAERVEELYRRILAAHTTRSAGEAIPSSVNLTGLARI